MCKEEIAEKEPLWKEIMGETLWTIDKEGTLTICPFKGTTARLDAKTSGIWLLPKQKVLVKKVVVRNITAYGDLRRLFAGMTLCSTFDVSGLDVSHATDMSQMFFGCEALEDISTAAGWNVSCVERMNEMFSGCKAFKDLRPLAGWDVSCVREMDGMFSECPIETLDMLASWNMSGIESVNCMFEKCVKLRDISGISGWYMGNVWYMCSRFKYCRARTDSSPIKDWDTHNAEMMSRIFYKSGVKDLSPLNWDTSIADDASEMLGPPLPFTP